MAAGLQKAVASELKKLGYENVGGRKHDKWRFAGDRASLHGRAQAVIVPRKLKSKHTANAILQDAGSELRV